MWVFRVWSQNCNFFYCLVDFVLEFSAWRLWRLFQRAFCNGFKGSQYIQMLYAMMSHQTPGSVAECSQGFPEPYFCLLPWAAGAALSHFLSAPQHWDLGIPWSSLRGWRCRGCDGSQCCSLSTEERLPWEWMSGFLEGWENGMCFHTCSHAVNPYPSKCCSPPWEVRPGSSPTMGLVHRLHRVQSTWKHF